MAAAHGTPLAQVEMIWQLSNRADPVANVLAKRHYSCQTPDSAQFMPPGRAFVLVIPGEAVWGTSWPFAEYVKHHWAGAWVNSLFRRESGPLASELIRQAVAATRWYWPEVPALGMVTFVDADKVHHKRDPGRCYRYAGFLPTDPPTTKGGLIGWQLWPDAMPEAEMPIGGTLAMSF
jgi:hypothetical protein